MFSIRVLPTEECGTDGVRLGEIIVGDFTERFACYPVFGSVDQLDTLWRDELFKLIDGAASVALVHDPRFAWIVYREVEQCFVQQVFSLDGDFGHHLVTRLTTTEDGNAVSEWCTQLSTIKRFAGEQSEA